jgi:aryl-alcohol dehydrogenase
MSRSVRLHGILGGDANPQIAIPMMLECWRQGRFPIDKLITPYAFERVADAFHDFHGGKAIKPVLQMTQS